jgi:chromosome segregation ATPase
MKKLIILLMAVSIMLTSCGKSAGLSNRNKKADNKTLSAAGAGKKQLPQANYKNSSKKTGIDTIKGYWHTMSDFFSAYKIGILITVVSLIALGSAYYYRDNISQLFSKIWKTSATQEKEISDLKTRNAELTTQNEQKDEKYEDLKKKSKEYEQTISNQAIEIERLKKADNDLSKTSPKKKDKNETSEIERLTQNEQILKKEIERLKKAKKKQFNRLEKNNNDHILAMQKKDQLNTDQSIKIKQHEQTIDSLSAELEQARKVLPQDPQAEDLSKQNQSLVQDKQTLSDQLDQNKQTIQDLNKQTQDQLDVINENRSRIDDLSKQLQGQKDKTGQVEQAFENLDKQYQSLLLENNAQSESYQLQKETIAQNEEDLKKLSDKNGIQVAEIEQLKKNNQAQLDRIAELEKALAPASVSVRKHKNRKKIETETNPSPRIVGTSETESPSD